MTKKNGGRAEIHYDASWIHEGWRKLDARYSNVLIFETSDPERPVQLARHLEGKAAQGIATSTYDPWRGLKPGEAPDATTAKYDAAPQGERDLAVALRILDRRLKQARSIAVLDQLNPGDAERRTLQDAVRSWANDPELRRKDSRVILFLPCAETVLDEHTLKRCIVRALSPSTDEERRSIASLALGGSGDGTLERLVAVTRGLNLHESTCVVLEARRDDGTVPIDQVVRAKARLLGGGGSLEVLDAPSESFGHIGGYEPVKSFLRDNFVRFLKDPEGATRHRARLPRGILLFGPPGTGKTLFANAIARELELPFVRLRSENIYSKWLGETGHRLATAIRQIEAMSPAVVFVDEIDRLGKRREATDSAGEETQRAFSEMLDWLGRHDRKSIIVGATNRPEYLDEAFLRAGRLDYKVPILYPDRAARLQILNIHLGLAGPMPEERMPRIEDREAMESCLQERIVPLTDMYSGAELEEVVYRAKRLAFGCEFVTPDHFDRAIQDFQINREERIGTLRRYWRQAVEFGQEQSFRQEVSREWRHLLEDEA